MRDRSEILHDALLATEKPVTRRQSNDKLRLLELEVLVDLRDELTALITILGSVEKIAYRAG